MSYFQKIIQTKFLLHSRNQKIIWKVDHRTRVKKYRIYFVLIIEWSGYFIMLQKIKTNKISWKKYFGGSDVTNVSYIRESGTLIYHIIMHVNHVWDKIGFSGPRWSCYTIYCDHVIVSLQFIKLMIIFWFGC